MNSICVIHPYKYEGMWVFDDDRVGLIREPFVSGADTIIDRMVSSIPKADNGFALVSPRRRFPAIKNVLSGVAQSTVGIGTSAPN